MTLKQHLFINEYLKHKNATKAVTRAYDVSNKNSAAVIGSRLLRNVKVREAISRVLESEESMLPLILQRINDILNYGSPKEQLKVIRVGLKLYGLL